ncbi:hypothetical protein HZA96_02130 [Candidatus Woesearchaeota archaeon]|nr:hypothetical protein [Candidatus Woesearchaeota archaeon]
MRFISKNEIEINKELSDLDVFTLAFIRILEKYTQYIVISGYVAILLGRSRASEDVDIIIPKTSPEKIEQLIVELKKNNFYCLQADTIVEIYNYLKDNIAVRFAKNDTVIPNIELKLVKNKIDVISFQNMITVKLNDKQITISQLELQIAFKEEVLKSPKDIEDARHLRNVAAEHLNISLINTYKRMLHEIY